MKYVIATPGGTVRYDVPVMKVQAYTLGEIFEKGLLMLIPFYIFFTREKLSGIQQQQAEAGGTQN